MFVLVATGAQAGSDDAFRCGTRLVQLGESILDVRSKCETPTLEDRRIQQRMDGEIVTSTSGCYVARITSAGSTEDARRAGMSAAEAAAVRSRSATPA